MARTLPSLPVAQLWRGNSELSLVSSASAAECQLPPLPGIGSGSSIVSWAHRFLQAYHQLLERQGLPSVAATIVHIGRVIDHLDTDDDDGWRRREAEAYDAAAEHYDQLVAGGAPDYLVESFQLILLLLLAVDQIHKHDQETGVRLSIAGVEEVINAKRQSY
ncbi:hypothetical protein [Oceanobacter mangrovi]|uniref:hypothetical protein n=1 Tax=Oceanobacter mangrovi TaxID=2862510 RepID=UPI001C8D150F|nr:hypothetical protein [Oceanobacter mangrovi]